MKPESNVVWVTQNRGDCIPLQDFPGSQFAQTPAGKLFLALLEENTWSSGFEVGIYLEHTPHTVTISSELFISHTGTKQTVLTEVDGKFPSMEEIIKMILSEIEKHRNAVHLTMQSLLQTLRKVESGSNAVYRGLARKAILAKVPKAKLSSRVFVTDDCYIYGDSNERCFFVRQDDVLKSNASVYQIDKPLNDLDGMEIQSEDVTSLIANARLVEAAQ